MLGKRGNAPKAKANPKLIIVIVIAVLALLCVGESFYSVREQEQAVLTMFGKVLRVDTAGLYFKIPFIQDVHTIDMTTHGVGIGYYIKDGQNITVDDEGVMITSDFNFVDIDFYLEYKVSDPVAFYYNSSNPEVIMKNMALACIRNTVVNYTVDDVITTAKGQIQAEVKEKLQNELTNSNIGMMVVNLSVQDAEPPTEEIVQAFKSVETAKQGKDTAVNNAKKYQSEELPKAEADADKIVQDAEAYKQARIAEAEGQVARFNEMYEQYKLQPYITKKRLFYETMEEVLPDLKVIITDGNTQQMLPLDNFNGND
ncbi:protease activity modulator HflK [Butyrivibrio proteoclasticus B316]|uniref:Protein HflK n=1 Tax=Butyrivibrio proteoclasticus (strain ATCC 51982 / DSM 14932 / B316) TaxID=515622 RepID=E0S253_BUTPB|nr:FtsH protease activity modulator HflK [Butyrivibrio proteoclasticus]ADL33878.1 protease activity modulator HflK [Butyrivibrio proteoclasticus B316]